MIDDSLYKFFFEINIEPSKQREIKILTVIFDSKFVVNWNTVYLVIQYYVIITLWTFQHNWTFSIRCYDYSKMN